MSLIRESLFANACPGKPKKEGYWSVSYKIMESNAGVLSFELNVTILVLILNLVDKMIIKAMIFFCLS